MALPHVERAIIPAAKLRNYLLSPVHPDGMHKAVFFRRLGYSRRNWRVFRLALKEQAANGMVVRVVDFVYGRKYVVRGIIRGSAAPAAAIVTIWVVRWGETAPRLITAYPEGS